MTLSKEQIYSELWRRGETAHPDLVSLHAGQQRITEAYDNSDYLIFGVECSRQLGKTTWGVWLADRTARMYPGCSVRIATAYYADLAQFIIPAFNFVLSTCPERHRPKYRTNSGSYRYPNGSEIVLVGLDTNPNKLRGNRLRLVLIEEAGFADSEGLRYVYESVIIPAFTHEPLARVVLISTPPEQGSDHTFCELVDDAALHDSYIKLTIYDNPLLTAERIAKKAQELGGADSITFRREFLCERIVDTQRALVPEWKSEYEIDFDPTTDPLYQFWHRYEFMDIGVAKDKTVCLFGYYNFTESCLYILDEVDISNVTTTPDLIAEEIFAKEEEIEFRVGEKDTLYRRIADNSHPILLNDLTARYGLVFSPTTKDHGATKGGGVAQMVGTLRTWVKAGRIKVHVRCKQLLGCLRTGIWDKPRAKFASSKAYGHYDALAALVYGVRNTDIFTNPIPEHWGRTQNDSIFTIKPKQELSPLGKDLAAIFGKPKPTKRY